MFILMGLLLDRSGIANQLMTSFARLFGSVRGGLAVTVAVIGLLLAATTGIIGASVVLLALLGSTGHAATRLRQELGQRHGLRCGHPGHLDSAKHHAWY